MAVPPRTHLDTPPWLQPLSATGRESGRDPGFEDTRDPRKVYRGTDGSDYRWPAPTFPVIRQIQESTSVPPTWDLPQTPGQVRLPVYVLSCRVSDCLGTRLTLWGFYLLSLEVCYVLHASRLF